MSTYIPRHSYDYSLAVELCTMPRDVQHLPAHVADVSLAGRWVA